MPIYEITMDNGRQLFIRSGNSQMAQDAALAQYPGCAISRLTQVQEIGETPTVETDETEGEDDV